MYLRQGTNANCSRISKFKKRDARPENSFRPQAHTESLHIGLHATQPAALHTMHDALTLCFLFFAGKTVVCFALSDQGVQGRLWFGFFCIKEPGSSESRKHHSMKVL